MKLVLFDTKSVISMKMKFAIALITCILEAAMADYWIIPIPLSLIARQNDKVIPDEDSIVQNPIFSGLPLPPEKNMVIQPGDDDLISPTAPQDYVTPPLSEQQPLIASLTNIIATQDNNLIVPQDGYLIAPESDSSSNETKKKKQKKLSNQSKCNCPKIYNPICANNITFLNQCEFECKKYYNYLSGGEPYTIDCSGACSRCNYIKKNKAVEYEEDYYVVPQQQPLQSTQKPHSDEDDTDEDY